MMDAVREDTWCGDVYEADRPGRTGAWYIAGDGLTVVDPGSARSVQHVIEGARTLGFGAGDLRRVVVTHVHLDHMGGVGQLVEWAPRAEVLCHPRAARHLADPTRLEASARSVYGDRFDRLWGTLRPVPAWRIHPQEDGARVAAGGHLLRFFDSPGHARHHVTMLDERTGALYTGDTVGVRYDPRYTGWPFVYIFPTTSPPDFDPPTMGETLDRLQALQPEVVCHAHFGASAPTEAFAACRRGLDGMARLLSDARQPAGDRWFRDALADWVRTDMEAQGHPAVDVDAMGEDLWLNGLGLWVYWQRGRAPAP
jgi:glyoxylase-like metal-dependent hydrolase (beta-lactamase superfamily II)